MYGTNSNVHHNANVSMNVGMPNVRVETHGMHGGSNVNVGVNGMHTNVHSNV